jgi:hypothetical protein
LISWCFPLCFQTLWDSILLSWRKTVQETCLSQRDATCISFLI